MRVGGAEPPPDGGAPLGPPPGFAALVPFEPGRHRGLRVREAGRAAFAAGLGTVPLTLPEFFHAQRHYPVAFGRDPASGVYAALAVTGLAPDRNLHADAAAGWAAGYYVPAYVRGWPFHAVPVLGGEADGRGVLCVDPGGLEAGEPALFTGDATPGEGWEGIRALLEEIAGARQRTDAFVERLARLDLLEPFEAHAFPSTGGGARRLTGLHRVSERRLGDLPEPALRELMSRGELARIYAHLMSLDNFATLLDRQVAAG